MGGLVAMMACGFSAAAADASQALAQKILTLAGVKGGLIVQVGCGDGKLTTALHANDACLVQALDAEAKNVEAARQQIQMAGLYGAVSAEAWNNPRLPYIDNLVNLVVVGNEAKIEQAELLRVLAPNGVAVACNLQSATCSVLVKKPRPSTIDEWTHYLHGPDNNAVAQDTEIDTPQHIQWIGDPRFARSHQFLTSVSAMVSSGGKIFYIVDEGSTQLNHFTPARWSLVARDAFNGVVLWRLPMTAWQPANQRGRIPFPSDLFRRLVAVGDEVYVTLDIFGPVVALDAATGLKLRTYAGTEQTEEIVCDQGVLYCVTADAPLGSIDRRQAAYERTSPIKKKIVALRAATGEALWNKEDGSTLTYLPLTLISQGKRTFFENSDAVVCLDGASGKVLWQQARKTPFARQAWSTPTLVVADGVVLSADRSPGGTVGKRSAGQVIALSADTGKPLWGCASAEGVSMPLDVLVAHGMVWTGENLGHKDLDFRTVRDLHTGKVVKQYGATDGWADWHHHRCYREKATTRFLLAARTGVEFIDANSGHLTPHNWIRGICRYGILPCNGLLYLPPDQCACYIESKLTGFNVLAPKRKSEAPIVPASQPRLVEGPAYGKLANAAAPNLEDWPTFRHDPARSGQAGTVVAGELKPKWSAELGGKLTSLVCANGRVLVCQPEAHKVVCLEAESGKVAWQFTAGGRVDSPPTIAQGLAVFGSKDGYVYALRVEDGQLAWAFRAAPDEQRLVAYGQVESVWPVHGSTLVEGDAVYFAAGRNSYIDGGVTLYKLELATGKTLIEKRCYSRDANTGKATDLYKRFQGAILPDREMPGILPDVFSADAHGLYLRSVSLTRNLQPLGLGQPHVFCSMGLLDDASWERTYWLYGTHMYGGAAGWGYAQSVEPAGRILAFDDARVYAFQDETFASSGLYATPRPTKPYSTGGGHKLSKAQIRADRNKKDDGKARKEKTAGGDADEGGMGAATYASNWRNDVPLNVRAMLLAGDRVIVSGAPRYKEEKVLGYLENCRTDTPAETVPLLAEAQASVDGKKGSLVWVVNKADGKRVTECKLESAPVFDGLIAARGTLYMATLDGKVICLGK